MKKIILIICFMFSFINCLSQINIKKNESFEFINGNEKIWFEILSINDFLELNTVNKTIFKFKNIDPKITSISGKSIRYSKDNENSENELIIEMTPKLEDLEEEKLIVRLSYKTNGELKIFKIKIPVKIK